MVTKRRLYLFAFQLPFTLVVGALLSFGYSMRVHDDPHIDLVAAIVLGIVLDIVITLINKRDEQQHYESR